MSKRILTYILLLTFGFSLRCNSQISYGGTPASFSHLKSASVPIPVVEMPRVSNLALQMEALQSKDLFKNQKFAKSFEVDITPSNSGVWNNVDGMKIWRVAFRSEGAYSLNLIFDKAIMPTGASLFIYSADHQIIRGAFNANNEQSSGMLPIYPLATDEIVVEYDEPEHVSLTGELHIAKVNHGFKNAIGTRPLGEAGTCNMDVYCKGASMMLKEKQAVVQLVIGGTNLCTGTLVNNSQRDKTPYLITAGHCIFNAMDAQQTVFSFNYESPNCGKNGSLNGFADQTMTGSILRARSDSLDFALVELEMLPPPDYRPYYAGWDRSKVLPVSSRTVHHPQGDVKKVSIDSDPPLISSYSSSGKIQNAFYLVKKWDIGTTEKGSSGGPLFSESNHLVGTLTGGFATCENSIDDYFSQFALQWNYYSSPSNQLKKWLDPTNSGIQKIEAMDPYTAGESCDQFSDVGTDEKYELAKVTAGRGYITGHNSWRISSYAQEFSTSEKTTLSAFAVGIAKVTSGVYNSNSNVLFHIYSMDDKKGTPGTVLKSIKLPMKSLTTAAMNFIALDQPLQITGKYFIGYEINYTNATDTVAVYSAVPRTESQKNHAYCIMNGSWEPFYWIPEINVRTSLLINAFGCGTTFVPGDTIPTPAPGSRFKIYYPTNQNINSLYLINTGNEEFGRVAFYDLLGRKVAEHQRILTNSPMELDCSQFLSSVYFVAVETLTGREVIKVKIIRNW